MRSASPSVDRGPAAPAAAPSPARLTVELRRDLDLPPDDDVAFAALLESRPPVAVFLSKAWLSGLFAEPPEGFAPSLAVLREGGALRGVAPLAVRHAPTHVRVALLGGGAGSDRTDLLAAPGHEALCADALLSWLGEAFGRGFVLELRDVPAESPLWGAVRRASAGRSPRLTLQPREIHALPVLALPAAASGAGLAPVHPRSLEKHRRWLERRGRLRIDLLEDPGEVMAAFTTLTGFLHARWRDHPSGSALDHPRAQRFHRQALPRLLVEGRLRMIRLSADLRTVAVYYGLASGRWWGYYLAGYDRDWAGRIHLGQVALAAAVDLASREGAAEFDFLKGVEPVKYLWPVRERVTLDADVHSGHGGAQLDRAVRAAREAAAGLVKAARGVFAR